MNKTLHAKLSASGSKLWINCPGSVRENSALPNPDNEFSLYGSAAHALAESCLISHQNANKYKNKYAVKETEKSDFQIMNWWQPSDYKVIEVDDEMMAGVQLYLDFCRNLKGEQSYVERKVFFGDAVPGNWGTADFIKIWSAYVGELNEKWRVVQELEATEVLQVRVINVVDLKFGKGVRVFAENNSQAMLYGLGTVNDLNFLFDFKDHDVVNIVIVQPRLDHIDQWQITVGHLREWAELEIKPAATLALKNDAPCIAGPWCIDGFCRRGKAGCRTQTAFNAKLVQGDFEDVTKMADKPLCEINELTNDEIGMILPLLPGFYKWGKHLEAHAFDEKMAGRDILNYKVVRGRPGNRYFIDEDKMVKWVVKNKLAKKGDLFQPAQVKSPPNIEKAIKANGKKIDGLEDFWDRPEGKLTIAHISDKRPEIEITTDADDFNDVTKGE